MTDTCVCPPSVRVEYHKEREFQEPCMERLPLGDVMLTTTHGGMTLLVERKRQAPGRKSPLFFLPVPTIS